MTPTGKYAQNTEKVSVMPESEQITVETMTRPTENDSFNRQKSNFCRL